MDLVVVLFGAIGGLFLLSQFNKFNNNKKQNELEQKVKSIKEKTAELTKASAEEEKKTQGTVNEITKEQNIELVGNALADFFNNRKGGQ